MDYRSGFSSGPARIGLLGLLLLTGACAMGGGYPSLMPRAVELQAATPPPATAPSPTPDPETAARLEMLATRLDEAERAFAATEREVGRPTPATPGSEAWATTTTALGALVAAQGATRDVLADIGALATALARARVTEGTISDQTDATAALQARAEATLTRQQQVIDTTSRAIQR